MKRIFISYRRSDSDYALLLFEFLKQKFGREQLFLDTDAIEPGDDFVDTLERELDDCAAFISLIGRGWTESLPRLREPRDVVRLELATVLGRSVLVVPVLAAGTRMPPPDDLPDDVTQLSRLSAVEVRVHSDLDALVRAIGKAVPLQSATTHEAGPRQQRVLDLLRRQVQRLQVRAVELLDSRQPDRAFDELHGGLEVLICLQEWSPSEVSLTLLLGYIYKTLAQAFLSLGRKAEAATYFELAASVFELAETPEARHQYSLEDLAGAINGLGNIRQYRGQLDEAIASYRRAVAIMPDYAYAWHDLFAALLQKASQGQPDVVGMREALAETRRAGQGAPGLSRQYLDGLARQLARWETS